MLPNTLIPVVVRENDVFDIGQIHAEFAGVIEHRLVIIFAPVHGFLDVLPSPCGEASM